MDEFIFLNLNKIGKWIAWLDFIEWGSGECNQLSLANYKNYIGYDISQTAIKICKNKFNNDKTKMFIHMSDNFTNNIKADLSISLDEIYHLLEDNAFNLYMQNLFNSSKNISLFILLILTKGGKNMLDIENLLIGFINIFQMNGK